MPEVIEVRQDAFKVSKEPDVLRTSNVGDCLVLTLYDNNGVGGLAHIFISTKKRKLLLYNYFALYFPVFHKSIVTADVVVDEMLVEMSKYGSDLKEVTAKIAGEQDKVTRRGILKWNSRGNRKSRIVRQELREYGIPIVAEDLGGSPYRGRNVELDLSTGIMNVTYVQRTKKRKHFGKSEIKVLGYNTF